MSKKQMQYIDETNTSSEKDKRNKKCGISWTREEDQKLLEGVKTFGEKRWVEIAKFVGTRSRKQCRERFVNHISPKIVKKPWTPEEDKIILNSFHIYGNKWSEIGRKLNGRTARSVRNRYRSLIAKQSMSCFKVVDKSYYSVVIGGKIWM